MSSSITDSFKFLISAIEEQLAIVLKDIPSHHGIDHMKAVTAHVIKAIEATEGDNNFLNRIQKGQLIAAALLHDVDDKKIFPNNLGYQNARMILEKVLTKDLLLILILEKDEKRIKLGQRIKPEFIKTVVEIIKLVSCSSNDSSTPIEAENQWMLIVRDCDRLEGIGQIGIERCLQYTLDVKRPLHNDSTVRVTNEKQLFSVATPERFLAYQRGAKSETMIDHYYDKLLHIGLPQYLQSQNPYILTEAAKRHQEMIDYVLNYWTTH